jgi:hypothetical protein
MQFISKLADTLFFKNATGCLFMTILVNLFSRELYDFDWVLLKENTPAGCS